MKIKFTLPVQTIAWILWFLKSPIWNRAKIGLFLLIILFKFIAECASGLLRHSFVKVFISSIIIEVSLVLPQYAYEEDARDATCLDKIWVNWKVKINQFVDVEK